MADDAFTEAAAAKGLRLIGYSRPGYGDSTPRAAGATVADDATDVATILDHLGYDRFVTVGWSGGGPRSLACAALLPDRCLAAVCGVVARGRGGLGVHGHRCPDRGVSRVAGAAGRPGRAHR